MAKAEATTAGASLTLSDVDRKLLIEYVFGHRMAPIQGLLEQHGLAKSGKKEELKERVTKALDDGTIAAEALVAHLDHVEGWGNQHVYLYKSPPGEQKTWKKHVDVIQKLTDAGAEHLFNQTRPLVLPDEPTLSTVEWTIRRVRFVWVEKREWEMRLEDEDAEEDGILYKAYLPQVARGIMAFDWNLVSGEAALMIQRLPSGEQYDAIRADYEAELEKFIDIENFTRVRARRAIRKLEKAAEVLNRKVDHETRSGGKASFTSKGRKTDAYADKDLKKSRDALGGQTISILGNFYFRPKAKRLDRNIHIKVYSKDQRIAIFGECTEEEVTYVLSRIRQHSK